MNLEQRIRHCFLQTGTDKYEHGYDKHYAKIFKEFEPKSLLEVGVKEGRSIASWSMIFPKVKIAGLDITEKKFKVPLIEFSGAEIIIGDSTKKEILNQIKETYDVIIDDGSHFYKDIIKTFINLENNFNKVYVIEDVLYKSQFIKKLLERKGYQVEIYPSNIKGVLVDSTFVLKNYYSEESLKLNVDLYMLVIYKP